MGKGLESFRGPSLPWGRLLLMAVLAGCGSKDPKEGLNWNNPDGDNCDHQCWLAGREGGESWECDQAFDPSTGEPLLPRQNSEQGEATCRQVDEDSAGSSGSGDGNTPAGSNCPPATTQFLRYDPCPPEKEGDGGAAGGEASDGGTPPASPEEICEAETTCGAFCAEQEMVCVIGGYDKDGDGVGCTRHVDPGTTCACKPRDCD